jgi:hypothetical protein
MGAGAVEVLPGCFFSFRFRGVQGRHPGRVGMHSRSTERGYGGDGDQAQPSLNAAQRWARRHEGNRAGRAHNVSQVSSKEG